MRIKDRRLGWLLALVGVALLPIGMTIAVVAAFPKGSPSVVSAVAAPRALAAWPAGPMETHVAFDQAVDPAVAAQAVGQSIRFGSGRATAGAGRPGGDGGTIRVAAARLVDAGRTLVLVTDPHPREATYAMTLGSIKPAGSPDPGSSQVIDYSLTGVEATWTAAGQDRPTWSGWLPSLNLSAARRTLGGSSEHDRLWPLCRQAGLLTLRTFATLPVGKIELRGSANLAFEATLGAESARSAAPNPASSPPSTGADPGVTQAASLVAEATPEPAELVVSLTTVAGGPDPILIWLLMADATKPQAALPLPASALGLAWAPPPLAEAAPAVLPAHLAGGGDPARGAAVFASERAKCAHCHQVRGVGGQVGPDLSSLSTASRAWVYQNIIEPSVAIHPDYLSYTVALKDGRISMGIVRADGANSLRVGDIDAKFTTFPRDEVEEIRPSSSSIMPVGLLGALGDDQTRDLLAFLTSQQPAVPAGPAPADPGAAAAPAGR